MFSGRAELIAHIGYPTDTFASSALCNPWFDRNGIDAAVIPMSARADGYPEVFRALFALTNLRGALVTMPHKVSTMGLVDEVSPAAAIAGATNAVVRREDGSLFADQFDGAGFVRALQRKGFDPNEKRVTMVGTGGVGSAIAASLAAAGVAEINLLNRHVASAEGLSKRIRAHYPQVDTRLGSRDIRGYDLIVNATSLGARADDPLPLALDGVDNTTFVADAVNKTDLTPFLVSALEQGCTVQPGRDMLLEMVPAYLAFFGFEGARVQDFTRS